MAVSTLSDPVAEAMAALERGHQLFAGTSVPVAGAGQGEHDFHADRITGSTSAGGVPESAHAKSGATVAGLHRLAGVDSELAAVVGQAQAGREHASRATRAILDAARADPMPAADTALGQREALRRMIIRLRAQHGHIVHSRAQARLLATRLRKLRYLREHTRGAGGLDEGPVSGDARGQTFAAIRKALDIKGIHDPAARARWERGMDTVAKREATYNKDAQNGPAVGEFQFHPDTFDAYHEPGTAHSRHDRVAEACAFINYVHHRYGVRMDGLNLAANVQQADPSRPPKGY